MGFFLVLVHSFFKVLIPEKSEQLRQKCLFSKLAEIGQINSYNHETWCKRFVGTVMVDLKSQAF